MPDQPVERTTRMLIRYVADEERWEHYRYDRLDVNSLGISAVYLRWEQGLSPEDREYVHEPSWEYRHPVP